MNEPFPASCSPAPSVGVRVQNAAAFPLHHQLMEQENSVWVENVPTSWIEYLGESDKKPLFSTQCCRTASVKSGQPDQGGHLSCFIPCSLLPNKKSPQRNIRGKSLMFSTTDHKSWDQRASGNSKGSALAEWQHWPSGFLKDLQALPGKSGSDFSQIFQFPYDCYQQIKKSLFPGSKKPLFPYWRLYFLIKTFIFLSSSIPLLCCPFQGEQHSKQQHSHCQTNNPTKNPPT